MKSQRIFLGALLFCFFGIALIGESQAEFLGTAPTGLLLLEKKNHPYCLFVPPDYSMEKTWAFLVLLGGSGKEPKEVVRPWLEWAKQNHFLILVPSVIPREGSVPTDVDRWLFEIKEEVGQRYRINPSQILLTGVEEGAHYAAYLGLNYPKEFSRAVLVRRAWAGPFEKLMRPVSDARKQIPFYVALDPKGRSFPAMEARALQLEKKGYRIAFDPLKPAEDFSGLQDRLLKWFLGDSEFGAKRSREKPSSKWKEKFHEIRKNVFDM